MRKILASVLIIGVLGGMIAPASAQGWRGGYGGWHGAWAPYAVGIATGAVIASAYYRPAPIYYAPAAYQMVQRTAAYCPENGLYYPQTQACPSGWRQVAY